MSSHQCTAHALRPQPMAHDVYITCTVLQSVKFVLQILHLTLSWLMAQWMGVLGIMPAWGSPSARYAACFKSTGCGSLSDLHQQPSDSITCSISALSEQCNHLDADRGCAEPTPVTQMLLPQAKRWKRMTVRHSPACSRSCLSW